MSFFDHKPSTDNEFQARPPAKVAKVAKVQPNFSRLATLAAPLSQNTKTISHNIPWNGEDWRAHFHERVGIRIDGGLSEEEAETGAREDMIQEWLFQNPPEPNDGDTCAHCNKPVGNAVALPFLAGRNGHVWLHQSCWPEWFEGRKQAAAQALKGLQR